MKRQSSSISYRNDVSSNYMVLEEIEGFSPDNFGIKILTNNRIKGLLPMDYETLNGCANLVYYISAKQSLENIHKFTKLSYENYKNLIFSLAQVIKNINDYLLDANGLVLKKECIYMNMEQGTVEFCYCQYHMQNINDGIRDLLSGLLSLIDYGDPKVVRIAYDAQKVTASDIFTMDDIISVVTKAVSDIDGKNQLYGYEADKEAGLIREEVEAEAYGGDTGIIQKNQQPTFFEKAQVYFKGREAGEIFDDINELKIIRKIKNIDMENTAKTDKKISVSRDKKAEKNMVDDLPKGITEIAEDLDNSSFYGDYKML